MLLVTFFEFFVAIKKNEKQQVFNISLEFLNF